jgi:hypothetical protein
LASYRAKSTIQAAKLRALGQGIKSGMVSPDQIAQMPQDLVDAALNHPDQDFTPSGDASTAPVSKYPIEMQTEALKHFNLLNESPNPDPQKLADARAQLAIVSPQFAQAMRTAPVYNPVVSAQLDALNSSDQVQQNVIKNAATNPALTQAPTGISKMWNDFNNSDPYKDMSPVDKAQAIIQANQVKRAMLMQQQAAQAQQQSQGGTGTQSFSPNPFNPQGIGAATGGGSAPTPVVPGNPATTAAWRATQGATPLAQPAQKGNSQQQPQVQIPPLSQDDLQRLQQNYPRDVQAYQFAIANPKDPNVPALMQMVLAHLQTLPKVAKQAVTQ